MPYKEKSDLPSSVKNHLPEHAQEIYLKAFNAAFHEYEHPEQTTIDFSQEETAHKVAWSAVKKLFHKNEQGQWIKKDHH